ncbi:MAG: hypothetical protein ACE5FZ_05650 [Nitrospiria bacterium]
MKFNPLKPGKHSLLGPNLLAVGLFLLAGCANPPPARTNLDFRVHEGRLQQTDHTMDSAEDSADSANNLIFGGRVIGTKVLSVEGEIITEQWRIRRGGREASYIVKLTPLPEGGTHIQVTSP